MEFRIKEILKDKGITVAALAEKVGITQPNMSNIVNGKINPSIERLESIADALGVDFMELLKQKGDESSELYGLVVFSGKTYRINSKKALKELYDDCFLR